MKLIDPMKLNKLMSVYGYRQVSLSRDLGVTPEDVERMTTRPENPSVKLLQRMMDVFYLDDPYRLLSEYPRRG